jgi:hypothetical protein
MKRIIVRTLVSFVVMVVLGGLGTAYYLYGNQDRGMTADGRLTPPASARNAPEAPKFDASKPAAPATAGKADEYKLPTDFKLPTEMDIATPQVPEGLASPANGQKS